MFAIIEVGGKQQIVKEGDVILVEKIEAEKGKSIVLDKVLLSVKDDDIKVGQPYLKSASVEAIVLQQVKDRKVISFKYRRRKSSHTTKGHRQKLTKLQIKKIKAG